MTLINNKEHFKEAVALAKKLGGDSKRSFLYCINKINRIKKNCEIDELYLFQDFVKHSFCWAMYKNRKLYMNGKMILHGFQETFSVELDPEKYPHWSIHT